MGVSASAVAFPLLVAGLLVGAVVGAVYLARVADDAQVLESLPGGDVGGFVDCIREVSAPSVEDVALVSRDGFASVTVDVTLHNAGCVTVYVEGGTFEAWTDAGDRARVAMGSVTLPPNRSAAVSVVVTPAPDSRSPALAFRDFGRMNEDGSLGLAREVAVHVQGDARVGTPSVGSASVPLAGNVVVAPTPEGGVDVRVSGFEGLPGVLSRVL